MMDVNGNSAESTKRAASVESGGPEPATSGEGWESDETKDGFREAAEMLESALLQIDGLIQGSRSSSVGPAGSGEEWAARPSNGHNGHLQNGSSKSNGTVGKGPPRLAVPFRANGGGGGEDSGSSESPESLSSSASSVPPSGGASGSPAGLASQLAHWLSAGHADAQRPGPDVVSALLRWLLPDQPLTSPSPSMSTVSCPEYGELTDRLQRLAIARESLSLQVSVLTEQVGAQSEKIKDLESLLEDKRPEDAGLGGQGEGAELPPGDPALHQDLHLSSEVAQLKRQFASLERDKLDTEQRLRFATSEISQLQKLLLNRTAPTFQAPPPPPTQPNMEPGELNNLVHKLRHRSKDAADEIESLRMTVQQLASANNEKELHIEQLRTVLEQSARLAEPSPSALQGPSHAPSHGLGPGRPQERLPSIPRSVSAYSHASHVPGPPLSRDPAPDMDINRQLKQLLGEDLGPPIHSSSSYTSSLSGLTAPSSSPSAHFSPRHGPQPLALSAANPGRQLAAELDQLASTSGQGLRNGQGGPMGQAYYTGSLPRTLEAKPPSAPKGPDSVRLSGRRKKTSVGSLGVSLRGKEEPSRPSWLSRSLTRLAAAKRSTSAPNLEEESSTEDAPPVDRRTEARGRARRARRSRKGRAEVEKRRGAEWTLSLTVPHAASLASLHQPTKAESDDETLQSASGLKRDKKTRSLRNLFSKLKRSSSTELEKEAGLGDGSGFRRGTAGRSTTGGRLGWSLPPAQHVPLRPPLQLFAQWEGGQLADWLAELGLAHYQPAASRVLQSGRHLLSLSLQDMDKDLEIRNPLHRKKLQLALRAIEEGRPGPQDQMDQHQVLRWLDDIGLPQYRDSFAEARVDGLFLDKLTVEDLLNLKISSALHHASIARGIQVLRVLNWNIARLERKFRARLVEEEGGAAAAVQLWSHHSVSEWLRSIDLAEFTPNLMCAGVHGALLVLEPTFTAESLAGVLEMSDSKTLLRRHLSTHFNRLLGPDIVAAKRHCLAQPFHSQLSPQLKVKPLKKGFSLGRKKSKTEILVEPEELIAPPGPHPVPLRLRASSSMASLPPPPPAPLPHSRSQTSVAGPLSVPRSSPHPSPIPNSSLISDAILENMASSNV